MSCTIPFKENKQYNLIIAHYKSNAKEAVIAIGYGVDQKYTWINPPVSPD